MPDYELLRCIGHGSYGDVWLAGNVLGQFRAVKIIYRSRFSDPRPFEREFEGIQRFEPISRSHPSQLHILHVGKNDAAGCFYYVMELADAAQPPVEDGGSRLEDRTNSERDPQTSIFDPQNYSPHTLRSDLEQHNRLPIPDCIQIGLSLTTALAHLHEQGLVHRDIKPSNVIFVNGGAKLGDIGLVTEAGDTQSIVGTEGYLPPEGPGTPQADIFSLGKVLYEISTGMDRRRFSELPEDLPSWPDRSAVMEFNEVVLKACAKDPTERYSSATELRADLELLQRGKSVKRARLNERGWALTRKAATAAILVAVITLAVFLARHRSGTRRLSKSPEAERLYHQAVYLSQSKSLDRLRAAYTNLTEAVRLDPGFVDAYYQMFEVYFGPTGNQLPPHYNNLANFRMVATRLREVSPNSVQYHAAYSFVSFLDWKFDEAIEEARLAIKLDPNFQPAHRFYAHHMLLARGDTVTGLKEFRIAEQLDPADTTTQCGLGWPPYMERDFPQAIKQFSKAVQLEPRTSYAHDWLAMAYEADGQYDKAVDEYEISELLCGADSVKTRAKFEKQRSDLHEKDPRSWRQSRLDSARESTPPDPIDMARLCARLGYTNEVFPLLDKAYDQHNGELTDLIWDDTWDTIRNDPRFQQLMTRVGFTKVMPPRKK